MAHYDAQDQPPAAYAEIRITNPDNRSSATRRAKLDTGASMTVLPRDVVVSLDFVPTGRIVASGYDRVPVERPTFFAHFQVEGFTFSDVKVTTTPRHDVLLGRDALNHFVVTFDGKSLTVDMRDP